MAKDLVRTRRYVQKFYQMRTQLQAVALKIQVIHLNLACIACYPVMNHPFDYKLQYMLFQTLRSTQSMADAMKGVTKAMRSMNKQINLPQISKIMMDFEQESEMMDMKEEMMNDAIDDVMEDGDEEEESDRIVNEVLDEIGISVNQSVSFIFTASRVTWY